jgi:hypothetical protein
MDRPAREYIEELMTLSRFIDWLTEHLSLS